MTIEVVIFTLRYIGLRDFVGDAKEIWQLLLNNITFLLFENIRKDIYNIYGFVRFADEIVDSFHDYNKSELFNDFVIDLEKAIRNKIHLNIFFILLNYIVFLFC